MKNQIYSPPTTQSDYQQLLQRMYRENYREFRPEDLRKVLYDYFMFMEREITGNEKTKYPDANFSISEFEGIHPEMETLLADTREQKRRAAELLIQLSEEPQPQPQPQRKSVARVTAVIGDITQQPDCDVIVNAANQLLRKGGGVCGAIHRVAGPELEENAIKLGPIAVGEAVITPGYGLPNPWVIHTVGPRYAYDINPAELLATALRNVLELADARQLGCIAIPAISTGAYGYPMAEAGSILVSTAQAIAASLKHVREIRFVLSSPDALDFFRHQE